VPDKNTFANKVSVLSAFEESLSFIDEFYNKLSEDEFYNKFSQQSNFWALDAFIPAGAWFGNYFGEGAYKFLKKYAQSHARGEDRSYDDSMIILSNSKLSEKNAIKHFLLLLIESRVFTYNEKDLNDRGNKIVGNSGQLEGLRGFDENALIEAFIDLLKGKDRKSAKFKKLKLLSKYWDKKIQEQLEGSIQKAKPIEKPTPSTASFFYSLHKHFPKQSPEQLSVVGNRLRAYSV
jgi:hypothetical protein